MPTRKVISLFLEIFPTGYVVELPKQTWEFKLPLVTFQLQGNASPYAQGYQILYNYQEDTHELSLQLFQNKVHLLDTLITKDLSQVMGWFSWIDANAPIEVQRDRLSYSDSEGSNIRTAPDSLMSVCWNAENLSSTSYQITLSKFSTETHDFVFPRPGKDLTCLVYGPSPDKALQVIRKITDRLNVVKLLEGTGMQAIMTSMDGLKPLKSISLHPATLKAVLEYFDGHSPSPSQSRSGFVKHPHRPREFIDLKADKTLMYQEVRLNLKDGSTAHAAIPLSQLQIGP